MMFVCVNQDLFDNELKPLMESSVGKRDMNKVKEVYQQIQNQLRNWEEGSFSSLYGEATPSIEIGQLQKKFAKVVSSILLL